MKWNDRHDTTCAHLFYIKNVKNDLYDQFKLPTVSTLLKSDMLSLWDLVEDLKRWPEKDSFIMRFGVLAAETMKFTAIWYVKTCSLVVMYQHIRWARIIQGVTYHNSITLACFILLFFLIERKQAYLKTILCVLPLNFWFPRSMLWALHHWNSSLCWTFGRNINLWGRSKNVVTYQRSHYNIW